MGSSPQCSHQSRLCRAQPQSQESGDCPGQGYRQTDKHTDTHTRTIYPPTRQASRMELLPKKATPLPRQINRDAPVFHDAEESPHSTQNPWNEGWWQMTWGWSRYHHGWREQRGNSLCFMGQVLEPLGSEIPVQCWWDHTEKSLNLSSSAASSVTKGNGERVRQEHPSWGLLGHPTRALGGPGQGRAGDGPMGHRREEGKLQCETRALAAPLEQEREGRGWRMCILGETLQDGAPRPSRR